MSLSLIVASGSQIRRQLLERAGVSVEVIPARVDEDALRRSLLAENALPRDIADALAEMKAQKVSRKSPGRLVLGCDQVLEHHGALLIKPTTPEDAKDQLTALRADRHSLLSAAVLYRDGAPVWRHVGVARLVMRDFSDDYLEDYVSRNWDSIRDAVGSYKLEEEGVRLFTRIEGDYFNVLGLPLIELLGYLTLTGEIQG